ncbi:MAG: transcription factor S [Candidatus Freyarchaeota archaeon]
MKALKFCPQCGSILLPTKNEEGLTLLKCRKCDYSCELEKELAGEYKITKEIKHSPRDKTTIIEDEDAIQTMPTVKVTCPKCNHNKAVYWQLQTRSADEGSTIFYRCLKCRHTWRSY